MIIFVRYVVYVHACLCARVHLSVFECVCLIARCIRADGGVDICGVNTPMMYMGQAFAPFAFHYEDNAMFSINVLYKGASKHWYSVPGHYHAAFEHLVAHTQEGLAPGTPQNRSLGRTSVPKESHCMCSKLC